MKGEQPQSSVSNHTPYYVNK